MNFLTYFFKSFGLAILGLFLFLSLSFFGLALTINQTILNPDFTVSQVDRLDVASLGEDLLNGQILPQATVPIPSPIKQFIVEAVKDTIADLEPWLKQQMREVTYATYDYLEGRSQHLSVVIQLEPVKESLRDNLRETLLPSPPPGLARFSLDNIERYIDEFYQQIPSTFELNEAWLGPQNMAQLRLMKQFIGHFHTIYYALIGFILLLIIAIILIYHEVRGSTRTLGTTFLSCGIVSYAGVWLTKYYIGVQLAQPQVPVYLQSWLPQLLADTLAPMEMYSLGLLAVGIVLLVVSFVYKSSEPSL
jgi:hypothetical protein